MECSSCLALLFILLSSVSSGGIAASDSSKVHLTFLQCLHNYSYHSSSHPISTAIYAPTNASFLPVLRSYARNLRFVSTETPKPLLIVTALDESHVQATVTCCKFHGLLLKTRSGGHDTEGLSYVSHIPFVVLDMFNLRSINIDLEDESMWVQSGAALGEVYYRIAEKSRTHGFPAGVCPTVAAGGHFSGGGYGNLMRKYGLSVDNIVDARLVNVEGRILDRRSMGEDLFWAIRGGGGASFGVILSWKLKLVHVTDVVTVFKVNRTLEQGATDLVHKWQQVASNLSRDLFIRLMLTSPVDEEGKKTVVAKFMALFLGKTEKLLQLMNESMAELGLLEKDCSEMSWIESVLYWYDYPEGTPTDLLLNRNNKRISFFKYKSDFVREPISKMGLQSVWKKLLQSEDVFMLWSPHGGRMSQISESATPYPHRAGYIFKIQYLAQNKISLESNNHQIILMRGLYNSFTPYVSNSPRQAFLNYRDNDIGSSPYCNATYEEAKVYGAKYFNGNFDRLVQVKTTVDPHNFFRNEQSIPALLEGQNYPCSAWSINFGFFMSDIAVRTTANIIVSLIEKKLPCRVRNIWSEGIV